MYPHIPLWDGELKNTYFHIQIHKIDHNHDTGTKLEFDCSSELRSQLGFSSKIECSNYAPLGSEPFQLGLAQLGKFQPELITSSYSISIVNTLALLSNNYFLHNKKLSGSLEARNFAKNQYPQIILCQNLNLAVYFSIENNSLVEHSLLKSFFVNFNF